VSLETLDTGRLIDCLNRQNERRLGSCRPPQAMFRTALYLSLVRAPLRSQ
jgi:hypothetical protein